MNINAFQLNTGKKNIFKSQKKKIFNQKCFPEKSLTFHLN